MRLERIDGSRHVGDVLLTLLFHFFDLKVQFLVEFELVGHFLGFVLGLLQRFIVAFFNLRQRGSPFFFRFVLQILKFGCESFQLIFFRGQERFLLLEFRGKSRVFLVIVRGVLPAGLVKRAQIRFKYIDLFFERLQQSGFLLIQAVFLESFLRECL